MSTVVDLSDPEVFKQARINREMEALAPEVQIEIDRIRRRIQWCAKKASRLPAGANGRARAQSHSAQLAPLIPSLVAALDGHPPKDPVAFVGNRDWDRPAALLNRIRTVVSGGNHGAA
jgi:hypothetical protein